MWARRALVLGTLLFAGCTEREANAFFDGLLLVIVAVFVIGSLIMLVYFGVLIMGAVRLLQGRPSIALGVTCMVFGGLTLSSYAVMVVAMLSNAAQRSAVPAQNLAGGLVGLAPAVLHCVVGYQNVVRARAAAGVVQQPGFQQYPPGP